MILLLALHASAAYMVTPLGAIWPVKDSSAHVAFDIAGLFIHTFRLPLFFMMAGFFGAKLYYERGTIEFVKNRVRRIGVPLVLFWLFLAPLIVTPFVLLHLDNQSRTLNDLMSLLVSTNTLSHLSFFHLWFLFDLLIYYGTALLLIQLCELTQLRRFSRYCDKVGSLLRSPCGLLVFIIATAMSLLPSELGMLETPAVFARPVSTLVADSVFFLFGWGLYIHRDLMGLTSSRVWAYASLGFTFFLAHLVCVFYGLRGVPILHVPASVFASLSIWLLIYGIVGLFGRYCNKPSRIGRYISDSSYWCYLVHLPIVAWMLLLTDDWRISALLKYVLTLVTTILVCLLTYDRLVRSTFIGVLVNGRRHPR